MSRSIKKAFLALSLLTSCASGFALDSLSGGLARYNFSGISIGVGAGYNGLSLSPTLSNSVSATNTSFTNGSQSLLSAYLDLGYSVTTPSRWFFGGDFNINLTNSAQQTSTAVTKSAVDTQLSVKNSNNYTFAADALGGYMLADDILLYLRVGLGYSANDMTASTSTTGASINAPATDNESLILIRAGLGLKYTVTQNFNVTFSYIHTMTQNLSQAISITDTGAATYSVTARQNPSWNALMIGLEMQCSSVAC